MNKSIVEPWETEELSTGHYVHLEQSQTVRSNTLRIVFLHGLTQNLECWRGTAERIVSSNHLRADCVLIDMIGHGKTPTPGGIASRVRPDVMCRQVQRVLEQIGWMSTPSSSSPSHASASKITLAGLSLGGAVSLLWSEQHLDSVARIVRVAAAGLDETWYQSPLSSLPFLCRSTGLPNLISGLSSRLTTTSLVRNQCLLQLLSQATAIHQVQYLTIHLCPSLLSLFFLLLLLLLLLFHFHFQYIHITQTTFLGYVWCGMSAPSYGVNQKMPEMLKDLGVTVAVVAGTLDFVHRPHIKRWRPDAILLKYGWEHVLICNLLDRMRLDEREDLWWVSSRGGDKEIASKL